MKLRFGFFLVLVACSSVCFSQTAEELVNRNIQARGGLEKLQAIKTVRISGTAIGSDGTPVKLVVENMRPNFVREETTIAGMTGIAAYDGKVGWQIQPFGGRKDPQLMGEDDLRDLLIDSDLEGPLINYKAKGNSVEFMGHDEVDGDDALRLKVTMKDGDIIYYYLDPDTYLEIRKEIQGVHSRRSEGKRHRFRILQSCRRRDVPVLHDLWA